MAAVFRERKSFFRMLLHPIHTMQKGWESFAAMREPQAAGHTLDCKSEVLAEAEGLALSMGKSVEPGGQPERIRSRKRGWLANQETNSD